MKPRFPVALLGAVVLLVTYSPSAERRSFLPEAVAVDTTATTGFTQVASGPGAPSGTPTFRSKDSVSEYVDSLTGTAYLWSGSWFRLAGPVPVWGSASLVVGTASSAASPVTGAVKGQDSTVNGVAGGILNLEGGLAHQAADGGGDLYVRGAPTGSGTTYSNLWAFSHDGNLTGLYANANLHFAKGSAASVGTDDAQDLQLKTSGTERWYVSDTLSGSLIGHGSPLITWDTGGTWSATGNPMVRAPSDADLFLSAQSGRNVIVTPGGGATTGYFGVTGIAAIGSVTVTNNQPALNLDQTWNASSTPFNAFGMQVTAIAALSSSTLCDWQVGASSKFKVYQDGQVHTAAFDLPNDAGASGYVLTADGSGHSHWAGIGPTGSSLPVFISGNLTDRTSGVTPVSFSPSGDGTYIVMVQVSVVSGGGGSFTVRCDYFDPGVSNAVEVIVPNVISQTSPTAGAMTSVGGIGGTSPLTYCCGPVMIRNSGHQINVFTTGTFGTCHYDVYVTVMQVN